MGFEADELDRAAGCQFLIATIAMVFHVSVAELQGPTRGRAAVAFARQVAMYTAHVALGLSLTDVGRQFGRDRTTAAHACRIIEDCRDDPRVDRALSAIETSLSVWRDDTIRELGRCLG
ncbi:MAG: hypothetical protein C0606_00395 [Hyphomicrobiales bacterium]|nr:MAG: hypothetical protein C0606_00395 [Hyphomicrobiales bacterium]